MAGIEELYKSSTKIKCPFFRRRIADILDAISIVWLFLIARHKSLPLVTPLPPGCYPCSKEAKFVNLDVVDIAELIKKDWTSNGDGKGYYISGKLTKQIYRNDCYFDGPDPDMPVKGLRKYLAATAQLFDQRKSKAELISIEYDATSKTVSVRWRIEGVLNLPWHPTVKPWTGATTYYLDDSNLIYQHVESWDIEVLDAFLSVLFPQVYKGSLPAPPIDSQIVSVKSTHSIPVLDFL